MRFMRRENDQWIKDTPADILPWLWANDGAEAVAVDDKTKTYYCSTPEMMETYQAAWAKEGRKDDQRKAAMFYDLGQILHTQTAMPDHTQSAAWCSNKQLICSERQECNGSRC